MSISLDDLASGFAHVPAECGAGLAQAAGLCLLEQGHAPAVSLAVEGEYSVALAVDWAFQITEAMRRYWNDPQEAAEQGACGIALLLMKRLAGYTVVERSRKGTGFDWWLGTEDDLFQSKARLEVSGLGRGTRRRITARLKARKLQTERSDTTGLPAFVVIVEFGTPLARVERR